jgi:hypothetical protein
LDRLHFLIRVIDPLKTCGNAMLLSFSIIKFCILTTGFIYMFVINLRINYEYGLCGSVVLCKTKQLNSNSTSLYSSEMIER